eukprot:CAMPEP_0181232858 /NCGR_PEP_ID=MMETSP1096-20121128/35989_1 /TAXON_ID=156174 ORGANISM="Chrysochromulina ericina, Strain CCMP281" /NCGR_SAMPLE_ID=MMETSP1096 /ASSEMBLY_ACC=CAM_ASM_000453 /LENGTH=102 /DNA_ID=CAMNT_0023327245 /DNA_START=267 /DNA_END=575 /DNA_ORIENTATION=+
MIHRNSVTFHHPETGVGLSMITTTQPQPYVAESTVNNTENMSLHSVSRMPWKSSSRSEMVPASSVARLRAAVRSGESIIPLIPHEGGGERMVEARTRAMSVN